ncbi:ABC transporter ATP-binding protein [Rhizobium sp. Root1204]|uniref:ABC transporter ATP-binding protein n=1 Tax=Rhizobium sp. Root1204 TaxID=1736428 RepID=UPI000714F574|nr:ABC transporter ATP-binding protein [Rhizobium sp. Root1204]KQV41328.1 urea ABC transporter ATP-binding subunit UrtE [Rhizobium sp. Root1204]
MNILEVCQLTTSYGRVPALFGADFHINQGEFVGILGHNGMGKTTLLKTIIGFLPVLGGKINFMGQSLSDLTTEQRSKLGIGYVPQGRQIFPTLSVLENLRMGCLSRQNEEAAIKEALLTFPRLERLLDRPGGALSGGEQQLLALARCLCCEPKLILLDEPTEGIQPSIIDEMIDTLQGLRKDRGITMLLVEQNLNFISSLSDRVLVLQKGRITAEMPQDMLGHPEVIDRLVAAAF